MSTYAAELTWRRGDQKFTDNRYSRAHAWRFDGGGEVPASSSPHAVPRPFSLDAAVEPEEAFVASLASGHLRGLLSITAEQGYVVDTYDDAAECVMEKTPPASWRGPA